MMGNLITLAVAGAGTDGVQSGRPAWTQLIIFIPFLVIIYFMYRSQKKQADKRKDMIAKIKVGDNIITTGGIKGTVSKVKDKSFMVKIAEKTEIEIVPNGVGIVLGGEEKTDE
jgi:preprotein translocase subunit YajC